MRKSSARIERRATQPGRASAPSGTGSATLWSTVFRLLYRLLRLLDPLLRVVWHGRLPTLGRSVDLRVPGRRTGRPRSTLVTLLAVDGRLYVGHPNGPAEWTRNVDAADEAELVFEDGTADRVRAVRLVDGPERDAVIRATRSQQPFPANAIYTLARRHVQKVGVYYRLVPVGENRAAAPARE